MIMIHVCVIVPAYNEQDRIGTMLTAYLDLFAQESQKKRYEVTFLVVLNGCRDNTQAIVVAICATHPQVVLQEIQQAGKGLAITAGFMTALEGAYDLIGFVDADMATSPAQFFALIQNSSEVDGVIASRYMPGARTIPERPWIKRWGSRLVYEKLVGLLFGIYYYDYQCGAKIFKRSVIAAVVPHLTVAQWAFDVELLYWCKRLNFRIKELPTIWYDRAGSKLTIFGSGLRMLWALIALRWRIFRS